MKMAIKDSKLNIDDINYINAHGTSTPLGDEIEFNSVCEIFEIVKRNYLCLQRNLLQDIYLERFER